MTVLATHDQVPQIARPMGPAAPYRPASVGAGATGLTGKDLLRMVRRRKWMIILSLVIVVTIAVVGTILWLSYAPFFTAEAYLGLNLGQSPVLMSIGPSMPAREVVERFAATHAKMVLTEPVLQKAIQMEGIQRSNWFQHEQDTAIPRLMKELSVSPVTNTDLIRVAMTGRNKAELPNIVNAVAMAAVDDSQNTNTDALRKQIRDLGSEKSSLQLTLDRVHEQMRAARPRDIPLIEQQRSSLDIRITTLIQQQTQINAAKVQAQAAVDSLDKSDMRNAPEVMMAKQNDRSLSTLQAQKTMWEGERENMERKYGLKSRVVQDLTTRLATCTAQIADMENQITEDTIKAIRSSREGMRDTLTAQLIQVSEELEAVKSSSKDLESRLQELRQLGEQETRLNDQVRRIDDKLMELRLESQSQPPVYLRRQANTPREPSMPTWGIMIPLGVILGLVVGFGLAFLLEIIDTSVKSPADVSRRVDLPVLGMIPHSDDLDEELPDLRLAFMTNPNSLVGESFRQIRTCLLFSGPASQRRTLLITSPMPEDGRTTVTINLAAAMAQGGRKVLVVDANFRQPAIRKLFPQLKEAGLSNALVGQSNWRDLVARIDPNLELSAISSGPLPPNPAELLGSEPMRRLIAEMTAEYDLVLFDGAPSLVVSDSSILSSLVDGVVLVVRAGANTYGIVQRTRDMLHRVGAHMLGVVLNGVRATAGGYLRKSYETFYGYHEQAAPQLPAEKP